MKKIVFILSIFLLCVFCGDQKAIDDLTKRIEKLETEIGELKGEERAMETKIDIKKKYLSAMIGLKTIAEGIESYSIDLAFVPRVGSLDELKNQSWFVPFHIKSLPIKDPWGNKYLYKYEGKDNYWIASAGSDGKFEGFHQKGFYLDIEGKDIIFSNALFVYGPKVD